MAKLLSAEVFRHRRDETETSTMKEKNKAERIVEEGNTVNNDYKQLVASQSQLKTFPSVVFPQAWSHNDKSLVTPRGSC